MSILKLHICDFRNIRETLLHFSAEGLHIISGENGSGKTSLLESIYYLGLGKSFRATRAESLIRHTMPSFSIVAQLIDQQQFRVPVGVERDYVQARWHIEGNKVSTIAELAYLLPIRLIDSHSQDLIEAGPALRRQYLDWGVFYHAPYFLSHWRAFSSALKQRNMILRDKGESNMLCAWTAPFIEHGLMIDQLRQDYVRLLIPLINELAALLLDHISLDLSYRSGWDHRMSLKGALEKQWILERQYGYTLCGPQRADFVITCNGYSAKQCLSRGQQKLLICAMIIAQGLLLQQMHHQSVTYLVDDLPAELDQTHRLKVLQLLADQSAQVFITAIEQETMNKMRASIKNVPIEMFHVEQGQYISIKL